MAKKRSRPFRLHPTFYHELAEFVALELGDDELDSHRRAYIRFMQEQMREILHGRDPHELWLAVSAPGREPDFNNAERDCSIANSILLEGYTPTLRKGELDAIKLKVERDWNAMRERIGPGPAQPKPITEKIVQHAWQRCLKAARLKHGRDVAPVAFRVVRGADHHGRPTVDFEAVLFEHDAVRAARRRWRDDPDFRIKFSCEASCVAYVRAVVEGRVRLNGDVISFDHE